MDLFEERSQSYINNKRQFSDFLENATFDYAHRIRAMLKDEKQRLLVDIADVQRFSNNLHWQLLTQPTHFYAPFQAALKEAVRLHATGNDKLVTDNAHDVEYQLGFSGHFGERSMTPRQLQAHHLGQLVCVEGIATKCSIVRPKVHRTVHHSLVHDTLPTGERTYRSNYLDMDYHDQTSLTGFPTSSVDPTKDRDSDPLTTEFGLCHYADHQTLSIQEMPERAPAGLLPSSIDVVLDNDLVDSCKPGDRVCIVGIYRALPSKSGAEGSGVFRSVLIANHVRPLHSSGTVGEVEITAPDHAEIRRIAARRDVLSVLSGSIAPTIYGHSAIKKALLLLLLGGVEKNLANGTHIRGDINMLMVGDPSTAKSQLLRFILHIAPLAINTTGRGSSGVGLTAAVTADKETGDRRLEAGAMVLADRGVVCIDEFDKMSDGDRVAIHEVMEQQTVTIAKAGIHMALNARCSVVAAANPRYSHYDKNKSPAYNVNLPDSLLSRFDLLFIVLDTPEQDSDRRIAEQVLANHRHRERKEAALQLDGEDGREREEERGSRVWEKSYAQSSRREVLRMPFLRKYIQVAKKTTPLLTPQSAALIGQQYAELRAEQANKNNGYPITARCLETLIRLSSACAKMRLGDEVDEADVREALRVLRFAIDGSDDHSAEHKRDEKRRRAEGRDSDGADDDEDGGGDDDAKTSGRAARAAAEEDEQKQKRAEDSAFEEAEEKYAGDEQADMDRDAEQQQQRQQEEESPSRRRRARSDAMEADESPKSKRRAASSSLSSTQPMDDEPAATEAVALDSARGVQFTRLLSRVLQDEHEIEVGAALEQLNGEVRDGRPYGLGEAEVLLRQLDQLDKILYSNGNIVRI